ncbi:MAG: kelch repeat-containing protein, partial [Anaerolineae bacterium]
MDGDGHADILIGAAGYAEAQGKAYVFFGSSDGIESRWAITGSLLAPRYGHTATLLADGRVLVAGGCDPWSNVLATAELYDPQTGTWSTTGSMGLARQGHSATLLQDGRVLVAGGSGNSMSGPSFTSVEIYDPDSGQWSETGALNYGRSSHTATLLADGAVLVTGGYSETYMHTRLQSAELYHPGTGVWTETDSLSAPLAEHTATAVHDGRVVVIGDLYRDTGTITEVYDPLSGQWTSGASLPLVALQNHAAALLPDGRVLVVGGQEAGYATASARIYDPALAEWTSTGSLLTARYGATALSLGDGTIVAIGGENLGVPVVTVERFDPGTGLWEMVDDRGAPRYVSTATLLPDGRILVAAGITGSPPAATAELYDLGARDAWTATGEYAADHFGSAVAGAGDVNGDGYEDVLVGAFTYPSGDGGKGKAYLYQGEPGGLPPVPSWTLVAADWDYELGTALAGAGDVNGDGYDDVVIGAPGYPQYDADRGQVYVHYGSASGVSTESGTILTGESDGDWFGSAVAGAGDVNGDGYDDVLVGAYHAPAGANEGRATLFYGSPTGIQDAGFSTTGDLNIEHLSHTATRLQNGSVLVVAGGSNTTELYDPATAQWALTGSPKQFHSGHTATLLGDGQVLVTGGYGIPSAELYDPASGTWNYTGALATGRIWHTATRLADGRVLVAAGEGTSGYVASAEVYDPATGLWATTGSLALARGGHTATLLADGRVLVVGGYGGGDFTATAEIWDPATGLWTPAANTAGDLRVSRHAAVLLQDGRVLIMGGEGGAIQAAQVYDPATGQWSLTGSLATGRLGHRAVMLPDGRVLVVGGKASGGTELASAEVYDPATGTWSDAGSLTTARWLHTATLLDDGRVLVAGGESAGAPLASAEVYSVTREWTAAGGASEYLGISLAGGVDANGDGRADLAAGAPGQQRAYAYFGALGLAATAAPVAAGDVQTLILARMDGSPDTLSLLQVRDASHVPVEALITTTQYIVDQAPPGEWQVRLVGDTGEDSNITVSVAAAPDPPIIEDLMVDASVLSDTKISYRLMSDYTPVTMAIYANDGPMTETLEIALPEALVGATAITSTEVITLFQGTQVATLDLTDTRAAQHALITTTVDLSVLESGDYKLWVRVEDGVSPPVQGYVWGVEALAAGDLPAEWNRVRIAAEDYDAGLQAAGAATISIDHTPEWSADFTSAMSAQIAA